MTQTWDNATAALLGMAATCARDISGVDLIVVPGRRPALRIKRTLGAHLAIGADLGIGSRHALQCQALVWRLDADGPSYRERYIQPHRYASELLATVELAAPQLGHGGFLAAAAAELRTLGWHAPRQGRGRPDELLSELHGVRSYLQHVPPTAAGLFFVPPADLTVGTLTETARRLSEIAARSRPLPPIVLSAGDVVPSRGGKALADAA